MACADRTLPALSVLVTRLELPDYLGQRHAARAQQHQHVEQQVGRFLDDLVVALGRAGERELDAFLADLLRDARDALFEQARGVAGFGLFGGALRDDGFELREERDRAWRRCAVRRRSR